MTLDRHKRANPTGSYLCRENLPEAGVEAEGVACQMAPCFSYIEGISFGFYCMAEVTIVNNE